MSVTYLVCPPDESTWRIDTTALPTAIRAKWPDATLEAGTPPFAPVVWERKGRENRSFTGRIAPDLDAVWLQGDIKDCAEFAVWFRTQVPTTQPLIFCDNGYNHSVDLTATATADDLVAPFFASATP